MKITKPDIVISVEWDPCGYIAEFFKSIFGFKTAIIVHGQEIYRIGSRFKRYPKRFIRDWSFRKADLLIAVSSYTAGRLKEEGIKRPVDIIWNSYDDNRFAGIKRKRKFFENNLIKLVTLSRIVVRKGHLYGLKALQILIQSGYDVSYDIIGSGDYKRNLELYVKENNLEPHVKFYGERSDGEIRDIFAQSDIFLHPNYAANSGKDFEGFGIVLLEAMSAGLPIVAGRDGGPADIIKDGHNGILVDGQNPVQIADAVLKLKNDSILLGSIISEEKKTLSNLSPIVMAKRYKEILSCE